MSRVNRKGIKSTGPSGEDSDSSSGMDIAARNAEASVDSDSSSVDSCGLTNEELRHRSDMLLYEGHKWRWPEGLYSPPVLGEVWRMPSLRQGARTDAVPPRSRSPAREFSSVAESDSGSVLSLQTENSGSSSDSNSDMTSEEFIDLRHRCDMGLYQRHRHRLPRGTLMPVRGVPWHLPSLRHGARTRKTSKSPR